MIPGNIKTKHYNETDSTDCLKTSLTLVIKFKTGVFIHAYLIF